MKERLLEQLSSAHERHAQYCRDHLPDGPVREQALKSGSVTRDFFTSLTVHFDEEMVMLVNMGLPDEEVMLMLSQQLTQICSDLYKVRQMASNIEASDNRAWATARYAYCTFRALEIMGQYSDQKFKRHPSITSTYSRFLTRMTAKSSVAGLDGKFKKLQDDVKKLSCVSTSALERIDQKLEKVITANELKRKPNIDGD